MGMRTPRRDGSFHDRRDPSPDPTRGDAAAADPLRLRRHHRRRRLRPRPLLQRRPAAVPHRLRRALLRRRLRRPRLPAAARLHADRRRRRGRAARARPPRSPAPSCWGSRWWRFSALLSSSSAPACSSSPWSGWPAVLLWRALGGEAGDDPARTAGRLFLAVLLGIAVAGAALGVGLAAALGGGVVIASLAVVTGLVLIGTAFVGGARWLIVPALALVLPLGVVAAADIDLDGGIGEREYRPATMSELRDHYEIGIGGLDVDLTDARPPDRPHRPRHRRRPRRGRRLRARAARA